MAMDHSKASREKFRDLLLTITPNVYFQSPTNTRMSYPAIRYEPNSWTDLYANNIRYVKQTEYLVTVIDKDPDSILASKLQNVSHCRFDRRYVSNGMYHYIFIINY